MRSMAEQECEAHAMGQDRVHAALNQGVTWPMRTDSLGPPHGLSWWLRNIVGGPESRDPQLLHPATERIGVESQNARRAAGSFDDAGGRSQHAEDVRALELFERELSAGLGLGG